MYECESCAHLYDPIECRWQCPRCHQKGNCCEGAPLPPARAEAPDPLVHPRDLNRKNG